eukprot:7099574-Prymnesium_polylepis.2
MPQSSQSVPGVHVPFPSSQIPSLAKMHVFAHDVCDAARATKAATQKQRTMGRIFSASWGYIICASTGIRIQL